MLGPLSDTLVVLSKMDEGSIRDNLGENRTAVLQKHTKDAIGRDSGACIPERLHLPAITQANPGFPNDFRGQTRLPFKSRVYRISQNTLGIEPLAPLSLRIRAFGSS